MTEASGSGRIASWARVAASTVMRSANFPSFPPRSGYLSGHSGPSKFFRFDAKKKKKLFGGERRATEANGAEKESLEKRPTMRMEYEGGVK